MTAEDLGSVGKVEAGDILTKRKVYLVTMVQPSPGAPNGFEEKYNDYWNAVETHLSQLEAKAGVVMRVFAEGVIGRGDDAMLMVQQSNPGAHRLVRQRVSAGAVFEEFEDTDLFGQVIDWGRCLQSGLINRTVADTIQEKYTEVSDKRIAHLQKRLEEGILESEAAVLLSGDQNITLPENIERFVISPPELDALQRWVQQANEAIRQEMAEDQARAQTGGGDAPGHEGHNHGPAGPSGSAGPSNSGGPASPADSGSGSSGSGLWTPGS